VKRGKGEPVLHLYCVRRSHDAGPAGDLEGIDGAPVRQLFAGSLAAWISEVEVGPPTLDRLRQHERVMRHALRSTTPIPFRYGQRLLGDEEVRHLLEEREADFTSTLEWLGDRVEMGVRITPGEAKESQPRHPSLEPAKLAGEAPGTAYLRARRAALAEAEVARSAAADLLDSLQEWLADLRLPAVQSPGSGPEVAVGLAHLVHRGEVRIYLDRIAELRSARPDLRFVVTGPWAPYSFV